MGATTGTNIATRARKVLLDESGVRWLDAEILDNINAAQREIVLAKPTANSLVANHTLVAGTKQAIPTGGYQLLNVIRNTTGKAVRRLDREVLDAEFPDWHSDTASATVQHYIYDPDTPTVFWVYPQQPSSGQGTVELMYSAAPTDLGSLASTIALDDVYANAIVDYVLYRCYLKDADQAGGRERAQQHLQAFATSIGAKIQGEAALSPNAPGNPGG